MSNDPKNPVEGEFVFDASECTAYAVDLPPGACQGMRKTRVGYAGAVSELLANQAQTGPKAGIPDQIACLPLFSIPYIKSSFVTC